MKYNKKWDYWKAEVIRYYLNREEERFHKRHLYDVMDIDSHKIYKNMRIAFHCDIRKNTLPKVGDTVLMKYCKHICPSSDNLNDSRIIKIISHE